MQRCGNPECEFPPNPDPSICLGFCCEKCEGRFKGEDWAQGGKKKHTAYCTGKADATTTTLEASTQPMSYAGTHAKSRCRNGQVSLVAASGSVIRLQPAPDHRPTHAPALPASDVFWLTLDCGQLAFCVAQGDAKATDLWSHASNLGQLPKLSGLNYRERDAAHVDDADLCKALEARGCEHALQYFKRALVGGIIAVGLAGAVKSRDRAARVAAAVVLAITSADASVDIQSCSNIWNDFPHLVEQAREAYPKVQHALADEYVFWLRLHPSDQLALCIAHTPSGANQLWSEAANICKFLALSELDYRESQLHHPDDEELRQALANYGGIHACELFKTAMVGNIVIVGLGSNRKSRDRTAWLAASVASCISTPDFVRGMSQFCEDFPVLVNQAIASRRALPTVWRELNSCRERVSTEHVNSSSMSSVRVGQQVGPSPQIRLIPNVQQPQHPEIPPPWRANKRKATNCNMDQFSSPLNGGEGDRGLEPLACLHDEVPSPITPPKHPKSETGEDEGSEDPLIEDDAMILRVVFQETEYGEDDDIDALVGVLRLSLRNFMPVHMKTEVLEDIQEDQTDSVANVAHLKSEKEHEVTQVCAIDDEVLHIKDTMRVRDLKFTHDTVASTFRDGRSFKGLLEDLRNGEIDPATNLKPLKVYHWPGHGYHSRDNRRLKCLKTFQEELGDEDVRVRVNIFKLPAKAMDIIAASKKFRSMLKDFLPAWTTKNDGHSVKVRTGPQHVRKHLARDAFPLPREDALERSLDDLVEQVRVKRRKQTE